MSETDGAAAPEIDVRQWQASQDTFAKAAAKHSKDLADDEKVRAVKGDMLSARFVEGKPDTIIVADVVLNGVALPENICVIQRHHWTRITTPAQAAEPAPEAVPAAPEPAAPEPAAPEPTATEPATPEPKPAATTPAAPVGAPPQPAARSPRRLRAKFIQKRAVAKET